MDIKLADIDFGTTITEQAMKVNEEYREFTQAQVMHPSIDRVAEEAFDTIQALIGYLKVLGVDIAAANTRHMEKMARRHGRVQHGG